MAQAIFKDVVLADRKLATRRVPGTKTCGGGELWCGEERVNPLA